MFKVSKIKKCPVCGTNKLKEDPSIIRLETSEGVHEVPVCDECDRFFDKSAEVLHGKHKQKESADSESDEEF